MSISRHHASERGFGLFEVTLVLAAAVLVTAALAPMVLRTIHATRADAARDELRLLHRAMLGSDEDRTYGFVGDFGRLPFDLGELLSAGSAPIFSAVDANGVGYGWNGPYVNRGVDGTDALLDPWGSPYQIGVPGPGQLRSAGPNGLFDDADDLVYPPAPVLPFGTLIVTVKGHSGERIDTDPLGCVVTLAYSNNGTFATVVDDEPPFSFSDTHRGLHPVDVSCPRLDGAGMASESGIARVTGDGQQLIELHVELGQAAAATAGPESAAAEIDSASDASQQR